MHKWGVAHMVNNDDLTYHVVSVRMRTELYEAAKKAAESRGETLSVVVRRALIDYIEQYGTE